MAAPTFIASVEIDNPWAIASTNIAAGTATKNYSSTLTTQANDLIVTLQGGEDAVSVGTLTTTDGVNSYTQQTAIATANHTTINIATATDGAGGTRTITLNRSISTIARRVGGVAAQFRNHGGVGNVFAAADGVQTGNLTCSANSAILVICTDWSATAGSRSWANINGSAPTATGGGDGDSTNWAAAWAYFADVGSAGSKTITLSTPTYGTPSFAAIEILGSQSPVTRALDYTNPPSQIPLSPPFKRSKSTLWLLDPSNWGGSSLIVQKWFADELVAGGGGGATTVNATLGAWTWAGSTSTVAVQQISQTTGTWSWAGSTSATTQLINSTPGTWTWAGSSSATTQLINQTTGTWTWAGSTASTIQLLNAIPGTWTWAGSTAGTTQLINAAVGTWSWAGSTQQITTPGGVTTIDAATGAWTWAGSTQTIDAQQIAATVGAFTWAGSTASINSQSVDATPGLWTWAGSQAAIISLITIDAAPGLWAWSGSQASVTDTSSVTGAGRGSQHGVAIEYLGQIYYFDTEKEAQAWLKDQLPKQKKQVKQLANRFLREIEPVDGENAFAAPSSFVPIRVIEGTKDIRALVTMRAHLLRRRFDATAYNQTIRVKADKQKAAEDAEMDDILSIMLMMR